MTLALYLLAWLAVSALIVWSVHHGKTRAAWCHGCRQYRVGHHRCVGRLYGR